jgi:ferredoxin
MVSNESEKQGETMKEETPIETARFSAMGEIPNPHPPSPILHYERLAAALDALPNGFPRTAGGKELRILQKIFSAEEAFLASHLTKEMELPAEIAARAGLAAEDVTPVLKAMAKRGMVWLDMDRQARSWRFRLAPFIVGMYEASLELMDHELAHLVEDYMAEGGAAGIMAPEPALHRVVPGRHSLPAEWVLPYEDVVKLLEGSRSFSVRECICRVQQDQLGSRKCDLPTHNCLSFSGFGRPAGPDSITREEALALLDESERAGLVHTVSNVVRDIYYVCNCCGCCCGILRGLNERGIQGSVAKATYLAEIDPETCTACGVCVGRCQVHAITLGDAGVAVVDVDRCIGCGLCVSGCSPEAASLRRRPDWEAIHPPETFADWEHERLHNRELLGDGS